jgi:hypothetical protein
MLVREWLSVFLVFSLTSQAPKSGSNLDVLNRSVVLRDLRGTSVDAVAALLAQTEIPGEVVSIYSDCKQPSEKVFSSPAGATLRQALDYVSTVDSARSWTYRNGVIVFGPSPAPKTILDTTLGEVTVKLGDTLSLSTQSLLQSKEVQAGIKRTGLAELNTPLGLSAVRRVEAPHVAPAHSAESVQLRGKTLEQALNFLASTRRNAAWHYEQFGCGQKTTFRVSWLIQ